jgi:hypothetical protein
MKLPGLGANIPEAEVWQRRALAAEARCMELTALSEMPKMPVLDLDSPDHALCSATIADLKGIIECGRAAHREETNARAWLSERVFELEGEIKSRMEGAENLDRDLVGYKEALIAIAEHGPDEWAREIAVRALDDELESWLDVHKRMRDSENLQLRHQLEDVRRDRDDAMVLAGRVRWLEAAYRRLSPG